MIEEVTFLGEFKELPPFIIIFQLSSLQGQMSSKGEVYNQTSPTAIHLNVIDLPARRTS